MGSKAVTLFKAAPLYLAACVCVWLLGGSGAFAADEAKTPPPKAGSGSGGKTAGGKKQTSIDFEDELIEGEMKKPELFYLLQKKQFNFKRLIKLREDFLPEMRRDADEIRRGGSKH